MIEIIKSNPIDFLNIIISAFALIVASLAAYFAFKSMKAMQDQVRIMNQEFQQAQEDSKKQDESNKRQLELVQKQINIQAEQAKEQKDYNIKRNTKIDEELKIIQNQLELFQEQVAESKRANVIINFVVIKNGLISLEFKNIGRNIAYVEDVKINDEFLEKIFQDNSHENDFIRDSLRHLSNSKFAIGVNQSWLVSLGSHLDIKPLWSDYSLKVLVKYRSGNDKEIYKTEVIFDLLNYTYAFMIDEDPLYNIEKIIEDVAKANKPISTTLQSIDKTLKNICSYNTSKNEEIS